MSTAGGEETWELRWWLPSARTPLLLLERLDGWEGMARTDRYPLALVDADRSVKLRDGEAPETKRRTEVVAVGDLEVERWCKESGAEAPLHGRRDLAEVRKQLARRRVPGGHLEVASVRIDGRHAWSVGVEVDTAEMGPDGVAALVGDLLTPADRASLLAGAVPAGYGLLLADQRRGVTDVTT